MQEVVDRGWKWPLQTKQSILDTLKTFWCMHSFYPSILSYPIRRKALKRKKNKRKWQGSFLWQKSLDILSQNYIFLFSLFFSILSFYSWFILPFQNGLALVFFFILLLIPIKLRPGKVLEFDLICSRFPSSWEVSFHKWDLELLRWGNYVWQRWRKMIHCKKKSLNKASNSGKPLAWKMGAISW